MTIESWFDDAVDAKKYMGEVGRLWSVWLLGLGALAFSRGLTAGAVGLALLVAMFILMSPLQNRVHTMYGDDESSRRVARRQTLSARDRALRQLTYGRAPFGEAVDKRDLWSGLKAIPWVVILVTLVAAALVAVAWFEG
ncbi:MAG: hypothetical protein GY720_04320 [bacterium]|nr:hypothetical protein [bacterium]